MREDNDVPQNLKSMLKVAHLYYMQDMTMDAIARELSTSRSTVSRMLNKARDTGLVDIQIRFPSERAERVQAELRERYGVTAHVVPVPNLADDSERLERVAIAGARLIGQFFDSNMKLGIAWGATIEALSRYLQPKETNHTQVVQLNGSGGLRTMGLEYSSCILQRFAHAFGSMTHPFPVPEFFDDPVTKSAMWQERSIKQQLQRQTQLDLALFGIGSPHSSAPNQQYRAEYLSEEDYATLSQAGIVGDIGTTFYRADGSDENIPMNARATGIPLKVLRKIPRRICVVSGRSKLLGLRGALAGGVVTDLVIDEPTARWLVHEANVDQPKGVKGAV